MDSYDKDKDQNKHKTDMQKHEKKYLMKLSDKKFAVQSLR